MDEREAAEQALWVRAAAGDGEAFGRVFDRHRDRVFRHAYRVLLNRADAEDATAIAFLELWRRRSQVRTVDGSVLPWLLVTATNTSRNLDRSRRRYRRLLASLPHPDNESSAEDIVLPRIANDDDLADALRELSLPDARLLALVALEDYTVADAATVLGITPGSARTRLHRMRVRMQQELGHDNLTSYLSKEAT